MTTNDGGAATAGGTRGREGRRRSREVQLPNAVSVGQIAEMLGLNPVDVIKQFMRNGIMAAVNQFVDYEAAAMVVRDFGLEPVQAQSPQQEGVRGGRTGSYGDEDVSKLQHRPPVVTILGHVDHGKTTLLDSIRKANVVDREAGGITQHIGAYQTEYNGQRLTFIDTPGHEAFTAMRARGAQITDIAVLVVAADDGIMPQTIEAIHHAKAAKVPIVVAVNKMDRPDADPDRVKRQLAEQDLLVEDWGGEVVSVPVSAKVGTGIDDLLENLLVVAEIEDLKANPERAARGVIIEAKLTRGKGPVATVLVQAGTLRQGNHAVVGRLRGRIKAMFNEAGRGVKEAGPATPVEISGLSELPEAGDLLEVVGSEQEARLLVEQRIKEHDQAGRVAGLEEMYAQIRSGEMAELNLIVKTDVQGTIDAVTASVAQLSNKRVQVNLLHASSGSITEGDVLLAIASKALIVSFGAHPAPGARRIAEQEGVEIRYYDIIYRLIDDLKQVVAGMGLAEVAEVVDGHVEVRAIFPMGRRNKVAGVMVQDGKALRNASARVIRGKEVLFDGAIRSLRHFKNDVRELAMGMEGGVVLDGFDDYEEGDVLEIHHQEKVAR